MVPKINGQLSGTRSSLDIQYDPQRGRVVTEEWNVAGDNLRALANTCEQNRIAYRLRANPVKSQLILTATDERAGFGGYTSDTWQLLCNELQNDIRMHPLVMTAAAAEPGMLGQVEKDVESFKNNETVSPAYYASRTTARLLFNLLIRNVTHYAASQYVLRHTCNVSNAYIGMTTEDGLDRIYTTAELITEITTGWTFPCPLRLRTKIQSISTAVSTLGGSHADYAWGWLKKGATETTSANNRVDISNEYWFAEWGTPLPYPLKTTA